MKKPPFFLMFWLSCFLGIVGCSTTVKTPELTLAEGSLNPMDAWKRVLKNFVDTQGKVRFGALKKNPNDLFVFVNYIAKNSPASAPQKFSSPEATLAFYLNSYNALAMYNVILKEVPDKLDTQAIRAEFFYLRNFTVGGKTLSLYDYENKVIRKLGDERVHFALNCMSGGCPRLPQTPFPSSDLNVELEKQTQFFLNEERNVSIDKERKSVRLSEILKWYAEDFLKKSPNIIAYVNRYRTTKIPESFSVEYIPYDWTVNHAQTPDVAMQ